MKLVFCAALPQSSGVSDLQLHPLLDSAPPQACTDRQCHSPYGSRVNPLVTSKYLQFKEGCAKLQE